MSEYEKLLKEMKAARSAYTAHKANAEQGYGPKKEGRRETSGGSLK